MVLLYDGSLEGFFTAVFETYRLKTAEAKIRLEAEYSPELFDEAVTVRTRKDEARRVLKGIAEKLGRDGLNIITRAFLSELRDREDIICRFIHRGMKIGRNVIEDLTNPDSLKVMLMSRKTMHEYHRFLGLLRFRSLSSGEYYAPFEPDTNLLPLLGRHFASRFPDQPWMIHDRKRNTALVHIEGKLELISFDDLPSLTTEVSGEIESAEGSDPWAELWKIYHKKIGVEERANPKLQQQFMPKKHWKYLTEIEKNAGF